MDEGVEETNEGDIVRRGVFEVSPGTDHHHGMVVQVEEGHLAVLLAENEEYSIKKLRDLGREVDPYAEQHLW